MPTLPPYQLPDSTYPTTISQGESQLHPGIGHALTHPPPTHPAPSSVASIPAYLPTRPSPVFPPRQRRNKNCFLWPEGGEGYLFSCSLMTVFVCFDVDSKDKRDGVLLLNLLPTLHPGEEKQGGLMRTFNRASPNYESHMNLLDLTKFQKRRWWALWVEG